MEKELRALRMAIERAVLVVYATQGVEAQTLANVYLAMDEKLEIMPVLNKIDLASARPEEAALKDGYDIVICVLMHLIKNYCALSSAVFCFLRWPSSIRFSPASSC